MDPISRVRVCCVCVHGVLELSLFLAFWDFLACSCPSKEVSCLVCTLFCSFPGHSGVLLKSPSFSRCFSAVVQEEGQKIGNMGGGCEVRVARLQSEFWPKSEPILGKGMRRSTFQ